MLIFMSQNYTDETDPIINRDVVDATRSRRVIIKFIEMFITWLGLQGKALCTRCFYHCLSYATFLI